MNYKPEDFNEVVGGYKRQEEKVWEEYEITLTEKVTDYYLAQNLDLSLVARHFKLPLEAIINILENSGLI
jgi:hypothetical protein